MLSKEETAKLLPHEGPMVFIDRGLEFGDDYALSSTEIEDDHLAAVEGRVPAYIGLEMMAQTIAMWAGYRDQQAGNKPKVGFLLGTRRYHTEVTYLPKNEPLYARVQEDLVGQNGLSSFCCELRTADKLICSARINVFKPTGDDE
ncbi:hypothetical protein [uncultured Umboniibacter sp.]|uniref:ApeP family dehydratase n=1 Tax=uncultured Umboniibacter sp. TaxID=1798917 RepID=UPI002620F9AB|nr:hypothetical protein [uncultured Umboniibacter sp.]